MAALGEGSGQGEAVEGKSGGAAQRPAARPEGKAQGERADLLAASLVQHKTVLECLGRDRSIAPLCTHAANNTPV